MDDKLLATADRGRHWTPQLPGRSTGPDFADDQHGWSFSQPMQQVPPQLAWTPDGGRHWEPRPVPFCPWYKGGGVFSAINSYSAWIACAWDTGSVEPARMYKTTDGGQTWNGFVPDWIESNELSYDPGALFFADSRHGWLGFDKGGAYLFQRTTDGGHSWRPVAIIGSRDVEFDKGSAWVASGLLKYRFTSPLQGYAIYAQRIDGSDGSLLATSDGGAHWTMLYGRPPVPDGPIRFFDAGEGVAAGLPWDGGAFFRTRDGGLNWSQVGELTDVCGPQPIINVRDLSFPNPSHGWALVNCLLAPRGQRQVLARTTDGGATWHAQQQPAAQSWSTEWRAISFRDLHDGFVAAGAGPTLTWNSHGRIVDVVGASGDGGATFRLVLTTTRTVDQIRFISDAAGWMRAEGKLFATGDGGRSWQQLLPNSVEDFDLHAGGQGWVLSVPEAPALAAILATTDGGGTWARYEFSMVPHTASVTTDGGQSWTDYYFDMPLRPQALTFADARHGWLRDDRGRLYATTDSGASWAFVQ